MKNISYFLFSLLMLLCACSDITEEYTTYSVSVQLVYPPDSKFGTSKGIPVKLTNNRGSAFESTTDENCIVTFAVLAGFYEASSSSIEVSENKSHIFNGLSSSIAVNHNWQEKELVKLDLNESQAGYIIIKEVYNGGCQKNGGAGTFSADQYITIYNNSDKEADLSNFCISAIHPANAHATNKDYNKNGKLIYEDEEWIPSGTSFWYLQENLKLPPFGEISVAIREGVNHVPTHENSINFAKKEYYCLYDPLAFKGHTVSEEIPESHHFKAIKLGTGSAFTLSVQSPAVFIFQIKDTTPLAFGTDPTTTNYYNNSATPANTRKKINRNWILDGVEVFTTSSDKNRKRLTRQIDAGYVYLNNKFGYSLYRNVDKEATENLIWNQGLLVYGYNMGVDGEGDPSEIDAEASIKNGARIIYKDTNNSTNDFHQRREAALRLKNNLE